MPLTESQRQHLAQQLEAAMDRDAAVTVLSVFPPAGEEIATKRDLDQLGATTKRDFDQVRAEMQHGFDSLEQRLIIRMHQEFIVQTRWMTGVVVGAIVSITAAVLAWG